MTPLRKQYVELLTLRGYALRTHESYIGTVVDLARHYHCSPDKLSDQQIRGYLLSLHQRGLSRSTINVRVSALRLFYGDMLKRPLHWLNEQLPRPRRSIRRPQVYSRQDLRRLFIQGCRDVRARTLLMTIYGCGLRLTEACCLRVSDIDAQRLTIHVRGKGDKDRYTLLQPWLLKQLRLYWLACRPGKAWLFPGRRDATQPLGPTTAEETFYAALKRAGLPNKGGIHSLRHSFATHLLESGASLVTLKKLLGHAYFSTTAGYLHVTAESLANLPDPFADVLAPQPEAAATTQ